MNKEKSTKLVLSDEGATSLTAAIVKSAIEDYCAPRPIKTSKNRKVYETLLEEWKRNKATAQAFFESSRLFKLSGLSLDYLIKAQEKVNADPRNKNSSYVRH